MGCPACWIGAARKALITSSLCLFMTEDIYTAESFKFSWGHTQAPSSADGRGELLAQSELAHQFRQWVHQQHQMCPGTVTSGTDFLWHVKHRSLAVGTAALLMKTG